MRVHRLVAAVFLSWVVLGTALAASPLPARAAEPSLTLTPNQGPCDSPVTARGAGFPAGATVEVIAAYDPKALPPGGVPKSTAIVADDGTFELEIVPCTGAVPGADQDGTQYRIFASTPQPADPFLPPDASASAVFTVGPVAQRPLPTLVVTPDTGACNSPAVASGAHWPPGAILALSAFPVGSHSGVIFTTVTVAADGAFTLPFEMRLATNCSAAYPVPVGAQYRISAGDHPRASAAIRDYASVIYTITANRLTERCFAETRQCVRGAFLDRWERHGLPGNGYPLTGEIRQVLEDGQEYTVQYFERVRLELHPENDSPYDVLLGQFGRRILATVPGAPTAPAAPLAGATFVPETGHNIGPRFLAYWEGNGGLAQFGYPLTELFEQQLEDGKVYQVQYFERARFEYHPENPPPFDVLLGQFGRQILDEDVR